jgi:hypothetical protein
MKIYSVKYHTKWRWLQLHRTELLRSMQAQAQQFATTSENTGKGTAGTHSHPVHQWIQDHQNLQTKEEPGCKYGIDISMNQK